MITTSIVPTQPRNERTAIYLDGVEIGTAKPFINPAGGPPTIHAIIPVAPTAGLLVGSITQGFGATVEEAVANALSAGMRDAEIYREALRELQAKL